jgi:hypothetical protein
MADPTSLTLFPRVIRSFGFQPSTRRRQRQLDAHASQRRPKIRYRTHELGAIRAVESLERLSIGRAIGLGKKRLSNSLYIASTGAHSDKVNALVGKYSMDIAIKTYDAKDGLSKRLVTNMCPSEA